MLRSRFSASSSTDRRGAGLPRVVGKKFGFDTMRLMGIMVACLMALPVLLTISLIYRNPSPDESSSVFDARFTAQKGPDGKSSHQVINPEDKLLDRLLITGHDERSCLSRYRSVLYRKTSSHKPSSYLISRLRKYEELHKRCGPSTESYTIALEQVKSGHSIIGSNDCTYVVWISFSGLGNRILTIASAFLYALLTNRVLLVDRGKDMDDLFCEPFPERSWLLSMDFPLLSQFNTFHQKSPHCYGKMLKSNIINSSTKTVPSFLYLHLVHDYDDHDKLFFCDQDQTLLSKVPWLILKTDNYFVPSLFLISSFQQELNELFPEKGTVFHHLGRYLFHPSNRIWGLITRYYEAYLAKADERIGIQIRVFDTDPGPFKYVMDQILSCTLNEKLLPQVNKQEPDLMASEDKQSKAVLVTSLSSGYSEMLRNMYWEYPTVSGEVIGVYQPSHEGYQQTEKQIHNRKAWAEIYLLSLSDILVTSSWSTFGYVAQGLGGLKSWILYKPENRTAPDPPCRRAMSIEPCFHAPPFYDCKAKTGVDTGALVPHVRHCEDMSWGLKLVDSHEL